MKVVYNDKVIKESEYPLPCRECIFYTTSDARYKCTPFNLPNEYLPCYGYKYEDSI